MPTKRAVPIAGSSRRAEDVEREHVERRGAGARRAGRRQVTIRYGSPSATAGPKRPPSRISLPPPSSDAGAAAAGDLGDEGGDAERRSARRSRGRRRGPAPPTGLRTRGPLARALRAAHPDRGRGHAVGADRPPAVRAGDVRLAVGMSVAGRHGRRTISGRRGARLLQRRFEQRRRSSAAGCPAAARR